MTSASHVIVNVSSAAVTTNVLFYTAFSYTGPFAENVKRASFIIMHYFSSSHTFSPVVYWILAVSFFLVGSILPDIDSDKSMISKLLHFHLPIEHRTWTHTLLIPVLICFSCLWFQPLLFLGIAYMLHLIWDGISFGGVCFFYPFETYACYGSGAKVKKGHKLKVYRTGRASEFVLLGMVITLTATMCVLFAVNGFYPSISL